MDKRIKIIIQKTIILSLLIPLATLPMITRYANYYLDENWSAVWLSWSDDPMHTVTISWHWGSPRRAYVLVWNDTHTISFTTSDTSELFHITIDGLSPNSHYNYVIGYIDSGIAKNWSKIYHFSTAPSETRPFRILVHSDTHAPSYGAFQRFIKVAMREDYDFIIHCGDMVDDGYERNWALFLEKETILFSTHQLMAIAGNHEVMYAEKENYERYMALPGNEYWYYFRYSNAMFIALHIADYENFVFPDEERNMYIEAIKYAEKEELWRIVMLHIPPFDIFPHHSHPDIPKTLLPLLNKYKPHIVLMGHDHAYCRINLNGTQYVILGPTGGIPNVMIYDDTSVDKYAFGYGYAIMEITNNTLLFVYKDLRGNVIDSFVITKEGF